MTKSPEGDDVLGEAEAIFEESRRGAQEFTVTLPIKTAISIAAIPVTVRYFSYDIEDEKDMAQSLDSKLTSALASTKSQDVKLALRTVSIPLSTREIDFLNEALLQDINVVRQTGREVDGAQGKQIILESVVEEMACLVTLNTAFMRAGGVPRPAFTRFYEGVQG